MTRDEKLAVIAGNLRDVADGNSRILDFLLGNLYELVCIAADTGDENSAIDTARLVIPANEPVMLAQFCRLYQKYYHKNESTFPNPEIAEKPDSVAMPDMRRFDGVLDMLSRNGVQLFSEYGDSFASCAEDVQYGNCRYVLMPYVDPGEGRLRSFDKMRERYGLKIHCIIFVTDDEGREYGYQLCGLGVPDKNIFVPTGLLFTAETNYSPMDYLRGADVFGANIRSADFERKKGHGKVSADIDISGLDDVTVGGLLMYLGAGADVTIDGVYAEIHDRSKGFDNGLH